MLTATDTEYMLTKYPCNFFNQDVLTSEVTPITPTSKKNETTQEAKGNTKRAKKQTE